MQQEDSLVFTDPVAVRFLGDQQKRRIITAFMTEPRTALQAARLLSIKPPTMYHHVAQLIEAGLLVVVEEKRKRGTVEKYLLTPAKQMTGAAKLGSSEETLELFGATFDSTLAALRKVVSDHHSTDCPVGIVHFSIKIDPERLQSVLAGFRDQLDLNSSEQGQEFQILLVAHPQT